ncbi:MAG: LssY C-terminal domain-containing protein, partial [Xanthomonadales bacterium]|nr:LssY C-terminal domain-containing protein [Xanthomonadales bacterium]
IMPVVAGMMQMPLKRYIPASILAALLWAPAYLLPGVVFGASLELARAVALRLALLLCLVLGLAWALGWMVQQAYYALAPRTSRNLGILMAWAHRHPRLGGLARSLVDPSRPESGTLVVFAVLLMLAAGGLLALLIAIPIAGGPLAWDQAVRTTMAGLRNPLADWFMAWFNGLGDVVVLIPASVVVLVWLAFRRRYLAAAHWAAAVVFGLLLAALISYGVSLSRAAALPLVPGENLPLMHVAVSAVIYGFFAVLISRELPRRSRMWPYVVTALLVGLIGLARLYFGAHWLSDLLVGIFFGVLWVTILGIAYRTRIRRSFWMAPLAAIFYAMVLVCTSLYVHSGADRLQHAYAAVLTPEIVDPDVWWANQWQPEPRQGVELNVQYVGELKRLEAALRAAGWQAPPDADWEMILKMIQPEPTMESLPLLPASYRGQTEGLLLHSSGLGPQEQWVVRFWPTGATLQGGLPIWAGLVARHRIERTAWFFSFWAADPSAGGVALRRLQSALGDGFQRRMVDQAAGAMLLIAAGDPEEILLAAPDGIRAPDTPAAPVSE